MSDPGGLRAATGYLPIEQYGLIGNMRTAALVAIDGGLDYMCWPNFDSPSLFCRILDNTKGLHDKSTMQSRKVDYEAAVLT